MLKDTERVDFGEFVSSVAFDGSGKYLASGGTRGVMCDGGGCSVLALLLPEMIIVMLRIELCFLMLMMLLVLFATMMMMMVMGHDCYYV